MFAAHGVAVAYACSTTGSSDAWSPSPGACNLIVHLYAEVDDGRLVRAVRGGGLDDLSAFAAQIVAPVDQ